MFFAYVLVAAVVVYLYLVAKYLGWIGLKEIEDFRSLINIPKDKTWLMPAGDTRETLVEMYPKSIEICMKMGYNWTGRDHIIAYDTKRAV
jgi:hypothetical protein